MKPPPVEVTRAANERGFGRVKHEVDRGDSNWAAVGVALFGTVLMTGVLSLFMLSGRGFAVALIAIGIVGILVFAVPHRRASRRRGPRLYAYERGIVVWEPPSVRAYDWPEVHTRTKTVHRSAGAESHLATVLTLRTSGGREIFTGIEAGDCDTVARLAAAGGAVDERP